jgi:hypothetical protein
MRSQAQAVRGMTGRMTVAALIVCAALPCAGARASGCEANGALSGARPFLPDCRVYEMVTPPFKAGSPPEELPNGLSTISSDGDHVLMSDTAGFGGSESDELNGKQKGAIYEMSRGAGGWTTEAISPSSESASRSSFVAESSDFARSLWELSIQGAPGEEIAATSGLSKLALREEKPGGAATYVEVGPEDPPGAPSHSFFFGGAASDLSTIVFSNVGKKTHWPGDKTHAGEESLYAYTGTLNREPVLVGVKNEGPLVGALERNEHAELISECATELGAGPSATGNTHNAVSEDGSVIFFTALRGICEAPAVNELYARVDADTTVAISEPLMTEQREAECTEICREDEVSNPSPASFQGASSDGHKVFFTTEQPLLNIDHDTGNDIYEAELEGGALTRLTMVSHGLTSGGGGVEDPTPGENADVLAVPRISDNGAHVYFIARGELTMAPNSVGEVAQASGYNLYDYNSVTGVTRLVAVLVSAQEAQTLEEGLKAEKEEPLLVQQARCESILGLEGTEEEVEECYAELEQMRQGVPAAVAKALETALTKELQLLPGEKIFSTTTDGRYLIFESARPLTGAEDTSTVRQLFEYDASTGKLTRASIGAGGFNENGNTENPEYEPRIVVPDDAHGGGPTSASASLSVSDAGSVFFTSRDRLTPSAVQGYENVYEYVPPETGSCSAKGSGGCLSLISPGDEAFSAESRGKPRLLGTDQSGRDVFFASADSLVARDTDSQLDWYDARVGGGFEEASSAPGCSEDACQGSPPLAPATPSPGGSTLQGGEAPLASVPLVSTVAKPKPTTAAQKLAKALKVCRIGPRRRRRSCEAKARRRLKAKSAASGGRRR